MKKRGRGRNEATSLRRNARAGAIVAFAVTELVVLSPVQAGELDRTGGWGSVLAQGIVVTGNAGQATPDPAKEDPVGQAATDYHPKPKVGSIDHIVVPPPEISHAERVMAADAQAIGPISQALHSYTLHPAQLISVRNYIGQYDDKTKVTAVGSHDGVSVFQISDAASGKRLGQVEVSAGSNGEVVVSKVNDAQFAAKTTVEFQMAGRVDADEAKQVLGASSALSALNSDKAKPAIGVEMPALISAEARTEAGTVSESTAHFYPDGSGYEYGLSGQLASAHAEDKIKATGVDVGVGVNGPGAKSYVNYFGKPEAAEAGKFSRSVYGASVEVHMTLAEIEAKYGCTDGASCAAEAKAGALGLGGGMGLVFSPHVDIPVRPANTIEDNGIAAPPPPDEAVSSAEQKAFDAAVAGGDKALEDFVDTNGDSPLADQASNLIDEHAAASDTQPIPVVGY